MSGKTRLICRSMAGVSSKKYLNDFLALLLERVQHFQGNYRLNYFCRAQVGIRFPPEVMCTEEICKNRRCLQIISANSLAHKHSLANIRLPAALPLSIDAIGCC